MNGKPFCNMCFKAGKPESEYRSHWLRDKSGKNGVTVCPYLLSIECRYCHQLGHTPVKCPVLMNKNNKNNKTKRSITTVDPKQLYDVSELPPMPTVLMPLVMPLVMPAIVPSLDEIKTTTKRKRCDVEESDATTTTTTCVEESEVTIFNKMIHGKISWADICDSDLEDEE